MTPHTETDPGACRRICEELLRHQRVIVTSHTRPDGDSVGSSLALAWALRGLGIEAHDRGDPRSGTDSQDPRGHPPRHEQDADARHPPH